MSTILSVLSARGLALRGICGIVGACLPATPSASKREARLKTTYGASILEWVRQTYDGRMDFGATTTTVVEDLTGRKPLTLREWVVRYRDSALAVGAQAAEGSLKE